MIAAPIKGVRDIRRHSSNQGSVITFDMFGVRTELFIADAKYRASLRWSSGKFSSKYLKYLSTNCFDIKYINPSRALYDSFKPLKISLLDKDLSLRFFLLSHRESAKDNTDVLVDNQLSEAAAWCRDITVEPIGQLDLPSLYELIVIYLESDRIDALDPTLAVGAECRELALGKLNPNGRFNLNQTLGVWSSTLFNVDGIRMVDTSGYTGADAMSGIRGIVPVKELSLIDWQKRIDLLREV